MAHADGTPNQVHLRIPVVLLRTLKIFLEVPIDDMATKGPVRRVRTKGVTVILLEFATNIQLVPKVREVPI